MSTHADRYKALLSRAGVQWGGDGMQEADIDAIASEDDSFSVVGGGGSSDGGGSVSRMEDDVSSLSLPSSMMSDRDRDEIMGLEGLLGGGDGSSPNSGTGGGGGGSGGGRGGGSFPGGIDAGRRAVDRERVLQLEERVAELVRAKLEAEEALARSTQRYVQGERSVCVCVCVLCMVCAVAVSLRCGCGAVYVVV